jgi:predicted RNA binding protein YcfA (HicA-like mRNA interferase family)
MKDKPGLWANIHAKQERIKHGSGEHMRKPGSKGAPTSAALKASQTSEEYVNEKTNPFEIGRTHRDITKHIKSLGWSLARNRGDHEIYTHLKSPHQIIIPRHKGDLPPGIIRHVMKHMNIQESYTGSEKVSKNPNDPADRFAASTELANLYKKDTPGQFSTLKTIKKVVREHLEESAAWQRKEGKNPEGGLNRKGVESYRREHPGSKLQTAVTTKPSKLKPGSKAANRRKSFCARMSGMPGPMRDEHGKPTRKALSLRKWNC